MNSTRSGLRLLFVLALMTMLTACAGSGVREDVLTDCGCGSPEHDVMGCTAACAVKGECENPLCTCVHDDPIKKKGE